MNLETNNIFVSAGMPMLRIATTEATKGDFVSAGMPMLRIAATEATKSDFVSAGMPMLRIVIPRLRRLCVLPQARSRKQASAAARAQSAHLLRYRGL